MTLKIGVVIVSYNSGPDVIACVESLCADQNILEIAIIDNSSPDGSAMMIKDWLDETDTKATLIESRHNGGYAFGVNIGLRHLMTDPEIGYFWVLDPDMTVPPASLTALIDYLSATPPFSLLGGRVVYADGTARLQTDGGLVNLWTGVTHNLNLGAPQSAQPPEATELDFIMGGNMVASRAFLDRVGLMREDYFLYYEEVDWAFRRPADLPLAICPEFIVHHAAGTSIGSATLERGASRSAQFWKHRARLMFLWRFNPAGLPIALFWSLAKSVQLMLRRQASGAHGLLTGTLSGLFRRKAVR